MDKLQPCPFCGGEANIIDASITFCVSCVMCGSAGFWYNSRDDAIRAWNRRYPIEMYLKRTSEETLSLLGLVKERTCRTKYSGGVDEVLFLVTWTCSECGCDAYDVAEPNYCPNCGAKVVKE